MTIWYDVTFTTPWEVIPGGFRHQAITLLEPGDSFSDITGQPGANLIPDVNLCVCAGRLQESTVQTLQADSDYEVLMLEEVTE